jgi:hypothetical protein
MQVRGIGRNRQNHKSAVINGNDGKKIMERKTTDGRRRKEKEIKERMWTNKAEAKVRKEG